MTYWNQTGRFEQLYRDLTAKLVPEEGKSLTPHGELLRAIGRIYYDWFNNGGCNFDNPSFKLALYTIRSWKDEIDAQAKKVLAKTFTGTGDLIDEFIHYGDHPDSARGTLLHNDHTDLALESLVDAAIQVVQAEDEAAKMRTNEDVRAAKELLESDTRLGYEAANIEINAPLALQQLSMKSRIQALRWVLGEIESCTGDVSRA